MLTANEFYQQRFGCKVYKLSLDGGFTCPNRDGTRGTGGCRFCSGSGSGEFAATGENIRAQLTEAKKWVEKKCKGGKYIAYSVNNTRQSFHAVKDERVEVLDLESDVLVYHPETHELLLSPLLQKKEVFETFPVFSPDGRKLYFCAAEAKPIPAEYKEIRYSLCSIDFNPEDGTFGETIDTLVNAAAMKKSISFPRPSYDGEYIMFTLSDYGNFSIWHKEADLWLLDLKDGGMRPIKEVNSDDTESFHNWSSNSRWFVFSSRRGDGLYTRLYLASMDENGVVGKPFLLPQENPWEYYDRLVYSYNVPDFTSEPVKLERRKVERGIVSRKRVPVKVR